MSQREMVAYRWVEFSCGYGNIGVHKLHVIVDGRGNTLANDAHGLAELIVKLTNKRIAEGKVAVMMKPVRGRKRKPKPGEPDAR